MNRTNECIFSDFGVFISGHFKSNETDFHILNTIINNLASESQETLILLSKYFDKPRKTIVVY